MDKNRFSKSWINSREEYDKYSRSNILLERMKLEKKKFTRIIDLGSGNASFLRWCYFVGLNFDEMTLVDYDKKLMNDFYPKTKSFLSKYNIQLIKKSPSKFIIKKNQHHSERIINLKLSDLNNVLNEINNYDIISLSAILDIASKKLIHDLFSLLSNKKILYFSICFDGTIKFIPIDIYDKYIISNFNQHQSSDKSFGYALGKDGIKYVTALAKKNFFKVKIKDSSWHIDSKNSENTIFCKSYLDTIYKALRKDHMVDRDMLDKWYFTKKEVIQSGKINIRVGHKDILIET